MPRMLKKTNDLINDVTITYLMDLKLAPLIGVPTFAVRKYTI